MIRFGGTLHFSSVNGMAVLNAVASGLEEEFMSRRSGVFFPHSFDEDNILIISSASCRLGVTNKHREGINFRYSREGGR